MRVSKGYDPKQLLGRLSTLLIHQSSGLASAYLIRVFRLLERLPVRTPKAGLTSNRPVSRTSNPLALRLQPMRSRSSREIYGAPILGRSDTRGEMKKVRRRAARIALVAPINSVKERSCCSLNLSQEVLLLAGSPMERNSEEQVLPMFLGVLPNNQLRAKPSVLQPLSAPRLL